MKYEVVPHAIYAGEWIVEAIGSDREIYQTWFIGPDSERRAREYATWKEQP